MIHITIFENEKNECIGFQTEGHAGYAESGEDIVCAAASVLVLEASELPQATRENAIVSDIAKATNFFILLSSCFVLQVCAYCATACLR